MPTVEQTNTGMTSPTQLKRWLEASGRRWLVFDAMALVDALEWPEEVETLQRLITAYRELRQTQPTGDLETQRDPTTGKDVQVTLYKTDSLEAEEKVAVILDLYAELAQTPGVVMDALDATLREIRE